ncbi:MAG: FtsX-like permease family protein [Lachnospiraceae bacterium]|nr:FtsX-like permease family protein [Lachnospiraceae bacterium]
MIRFIKYKILNKKWLNFCLLTGVVLLSAFLSVYPMFKEGSLNRLMQSLFDDYVEKNKEFPATMTTDGWLTGEAYSDVDSALTFMNSLENKWVAYLDIPVVERQQILEITAGYADEKLTGKARQIIFGYIDGLNEHADLLCGVWPEDADSTDSEVVKEALAAGAIPCVISQKTYDSEDVTIGQCFHTELKNTNDRNSFDAVVVGIIEEKDDGLPFWSKRLRKYDRTLFTTKEDYSLLMKSYSAGEMKFTESVMLDYTYINYNNAEDIYWYLYQFQKIDSSLSTNFRNTIVSYIESKKTISIILFTFEIPIIALLLLFIYMISSRILEMETGEIAMLKSRGVSRFKVIRLYLLQSSVISLAGSLIGLPFGYLFCKLGAGTDAFLVFTLKDTTIYAPNLMMLAFAGIAFVLSMLFMTIPVIPLSKYTIIERKSKKNSGKQKALWEKFFLDIPLLLLSGYLLFNYLKQRESISLTVISGGQIDPIIFLDSSLFILGCGLFALRILHLIINLIYKMGRNKWKPAEYVAFLQIIRNTKKQGFISVFLVMTIAMGIFNSNLARSVNENMENRISYNVGCDYVIQERWSITVKKASASSEAYWKYKEPDYMRFDDLRELGVESMTKVIRDDNAVVTTNTKKKETGCLLLGINTKEFGETASLQSGLNDKHWYNYLNDLGQKPKGVLISSNLAEKYELKVGDKIDYSRFSPIDANKEYASTKAEIVGIIDSFPGYQSTVYELQADSTYKKRENYLIVANYNNVVSVFSTRPYEVWMKLSKNADYEDITDRLNEKDIKIQSRMIRQELIQEQRDSTLIQITNGMFSIGFIISLVVCGVGFLIYWILTIKERELIYGIYRSMGLTMGEIFRMLIVEQIFSSLFSCGAGFGVGMLTTLLFTKLISIVYLPREHNIPLEIICKASDATKMAAIVGFVLVICFIVIYRIIKNMNITKAIKLGED